MELFRIDSNFFYRLVGIKCERETLEYVLREMEKVLEEELPGRGQTDRTQSSPIDGCSG